MSSFQETSGEKLARKILGSLVALAGLALFFMPARLELVDVPWWGAGLLVAFGMLVAWSQATTRAIRSLAETVKSVNPWRRT
jgi:drug/metabolite transporter (DMT)-like permease